MTITNKLQEILEFCYSHKIPIDLINEGDELIFNVKEHEDKISVYIQIPKKANKKITDTLNSEFKKLKNRFN